MLIDDGYLRIVNRQSTIPRGFTLLELVVVIFIISAFLALVSPSFYGFLEGRSRTEPKKVASIIRYINDAAINTKKPHTLKIDLTGKRFIFKTPEGEKRETFETLTSVKIPYRGNIEEGELILLFGPSGYPEPFEIYFSGGGYITYNPFTSRVKLVDRN